MKIEDGAYDVPCLRAYPRFGAAFKLVQHGFEMVQLPVEVARPVGHDGWTPNVGEWRTEISLPLPRYMCTPQGRHGSKLRTVRMMSMPLKVSGPFSSKIGVFWTASSYGPGVPKESRGLAFQGVGGYGW